MKNKKKYLVIWQKYEGESNLLRKPFTNKNFAIGKAIQKAKTSCTRKDSCAWFVDVYGGETIASGVVSWHTDHFRYERYK